jgi:two-component system OmpR family sensor kinase
MGTMAFLRGTLITTLDTSIMQAAAGDIAGRVFETTNQGGTVDFVPRQDVADTGSIIAVYSPAGELQAVYNGTDIDTLPKVPAEFSLADTVIKSESTFSLVQPATGAEYHASVGLLVVDGVSENYTQMVIVPLAPTERVVATYIGIYGILALLIVVASAMLTRGLVTLTFRGLGQVESTAMSIASGDFSQRMTDVVPGTEVGRLKSAINAMLGRIDAAIRQRDATVRQMRRFIGDASHELRTPLVTVRGYAELYRMGAIRTDDDVAQAMERIEKEAVRMGVLVEDLLALARLDERRDVALTPVDLRPIARDAALDLRATSPHREVSVEDATGPAGPIITVDIVPDLPDAAKDDDRKRPGATSAIAIAGATLSRLRRRPRGTADAPVSEPAPAGDERRAPIVLGDENRIRQVIANLLGNARRFTAEDSPIGLRVGVSPSAGMAWIEVIDHGEGIPEQIREQIFQRFWRADNSRTRETGGSGLGLSIVASIVDALNGSVEVADTPGGGATFRVSLPLVDDEEAAEQALADTRPLPRPAED